MRPKPICSIGRRALRDQRGTSTVELALVLPLFLFIVFGSMQFAWVFMADYGVKLATDDTVRWLSINPDTIDSDTIAHLKANLPPGIAGDSFTSIALSPACATLTNGHCTGRDPGNLVSMQVTYDLSGAYFLPTTFGIGDMQVQFPTSLPAYTVSVMVE